MKRIVSMIMVCLLAMGLLTVACAEAPQAQLHALNESYTADLDGDGTKETVEVTATLDEYDDGDITVTVNGQSFVVEGGTCVAKEYATVTVTKARGSQYTLVVPFEYGPSDDPLSYLFMYRDGVLYNLGMVPALPESMVFEDNGNFSTYVRARLLGTWSRPADYIIASAFYWNEETDQATEEYLVTEVPRDAYPMGQIVTLKKNLPVFASRYDTEPVKTLTAGEKAIISATDDCRWLYIVDADLGEGGWVKMQGEYTATIQIGESWVDETEVFDGLVYAD